MSIVDKWMFSLGLEHIHASRAASDVRNREESRAGQRAAIIVDVRILVVKIDVLAFKKVHVLRFFALFQSGEGFSGALKSVYQLLNSSVSYIDSYVSLSFL